MVNQFGKPWEWTKRNRCFTTELLRAYIRLIDTISLGERVTVWDILQIHFKIQLIFGRGLLGTRVPKDTLWETLTCSLHVQTKPEHCSVFNGIHKRHYGRTVIPQNIHSTSGLVIALQKQSKGKGRSKMLPNTECDTIRCTTYNNMQTLKATQSASINKEIYRGAHFWVKSCRKK